MVVLKFKILNQEKASFTEYEYQLETNDVVEHRNNVLSEIGHCNQT